MKKTVLPIIAVILITLNSCNVKVSNTDQEPIPVKNVGPVTPPLPAPPISCITKKVIAYQVVELVAPDPVATVKDLLANGWQPLGGVCVRSSGGGNYAQAFVMYEK